ncbi:zinc metallo proteinase [Diaporthe sp. PMI_573]|nr:zinc metallo proteinase [Diaporthaceae sp. PMI_573]
MEAALTENTYGDLVFENIEDGETVHQRCLIIKARFATAASAPSFLTVEQSSASFDELFPPQTWPVEEANTKIIVILSAGVNILAIHPNSDATQVYKLKIGYTPILRLPPLHLVVMFGADSDLTIDFEPGKAHPSIGDPSSIGSAAARFRMAAYMWQAMLAEDMRMKGLGRRSFRLDESWDIDTTSARFLHAVLQGDASDAGVTRNTAKIHFVRSEHTVEEIRNEEIAQDNPHGSNSKRLHSWFLEALDLSGIGIFTEAARPIVAGLIIDSDWVEEDLFAHGHAALGSHEPTGVSLCTMGSHLMYSWPEHLEAITSCLRDASRPEQGVVSAANSETGTMWEVCSIGQVEFLHQLGHAFGAGHTTGIMKDRRARHWPRNFIARTAPDTQTGAEGLVVDGNTANEAVFDIKDLLAFRHLPHFWMPGDPKLSGDPLAIRLDIPSIGVKYWRDEDGNTDPQIMSNSPAEIVRVLWNGETSLNPSVASPMDGVRLPVSWIESHFSRDQPVRLAFLGGNGKERVVPNVWDLLEDSSILRIPGSDIMLHRRSIMCNDLEEGLNGMANEKYWSWATLLTRQMEHGTIAHVNEINIYIRDYLIGLYVRFLDGIRVNCGPRFQAMADGKYEKHFSGHQQDVPIPPSHEVVRVDVSRDADALRGVKIHLSNGDVKGALSGGSKFDECCVLDPPSGERIVGFYGRNYFGQSIDGMVEFGIITAPSGVELPAQVYDMPQLQNTDGGLTVSDPRARAMFQEPSADFYGI